MEEKIREQARRGNRGTEQENRAGEKAGKKKRERGGEAWRKGTLFRRHYKHIEKISLAQKP